MIRRLRFTILCHRHSDEIYRYARSLLGNAVDAEDATQEVLLRLWRNFSEVPFLKTRAWLYRTTRNLCLDQLRRRARVEVPVAHGSSDFDEIADHDAENPAETADRDPLRRRIDAALRSLPDVWRSVFVLYEVNGLRYREIAEHLGIPLNSVRVYVSRARKRLQELLRKEKQWTNP